MRLHFPWNEVAKALEEVRTARRIRSLYGTETGPGLWLVGDEGVYLMPNTATAQPTIVYAAECNPKKLDFDTWWANKRASFGGDDGVEFIGLADIERLLESPAGPGIFPIAVLIDISPQKFSVELQWPPKSAAPKPKKARRS